MLMACQIAIIITKNGKLVSKIKICNISRSLCCCNIWLRFLWKKILPFCMQPQLVTLFPTVLPPSESQASLQLLSCVCELPVGLHLRSGCDLLWWVRVCVCVCVCVCLSVCLSARISPEPHAQSLPNFCACRLWPWLGPTPASLRYVMYFRFRGWHHVSCLYKGLYSGMNFATNDRFRLHLLIYRKVGQNSISYY